MTGPPCSGKTTYVAEHRSDDDLVLDLDQIAHALGYPDVQVEWGSEHPAAQAARIARTHLLHGLLNGTVTGPAWIIDTQPDDRLLAQYDRVGAELVHLDTPREVCLDRARATRTEQAVAAIEAWFDARSTAPPSASQAGRPAALEVFG